MLLAGKSEQQIMRQVEAIVEGALKYNLTVMVVSNEVGSGIVPENDLGRRFRDLAGLANQIIAGAAAEVYLLVSGIPVRIKGQQE